MKAGSGMIRNGIDITKCDIRCCGDLMYEDNYINAVYELWFDVETYFDITLDDNSWINLYTNWFSNGDIEVIVEYDADKGDKISYLPFEPDEETNKEKSVEKPNKTAIETNLSALTTMTDNNTTPMRFIN